MLGPLLFLIYINGVTCVVSNGKMVVYADDIALYQIIQSTEDYLLVHDILMLSLSGLYCQLSGLELSKMLPSTLLT